MAIMLMSLTPHLPGERSSPCRSEFGGAPLRFWGPSPKTFGFYQ
jgi:hypothetical protein